MTPSSSPFHYERNGSACLEVGRASLHLALRLHVMLIKHWYLHGVLTPRLTKARRSAFQPWTKGTLWGRCAIPGGVPLRSVPRSSHLSCSHPNHVSQMTTSSQNKKVPPLISRLSLRLKAAGEIKKATLDSRTCYDKQEGAT